MNRVLTAGQMREVDRRTIELGIPGIVLMENAAMRVVEFLERRFAPLREQRIVVFCGKGNNGGDGLAIARQLYTRFRPRALQVAMVGAPADLKGDAALNFRMLMACGFPFGQEAAGATLVIDAVLGTGVTGRASGAALDAIRRMNSGFPGAKVVAVDIPSGIASDSGQLAGEFVRADCTVTFTALKTAHALPPACDAMGEWIVSPIGSPAQLYDDVRLGQVSAQAIAPLFAPRKKEANKGSYGHVLTVAGSPGRTGAAAMCGVAALRAGAGLVTVASAAAALPAIAAHAPELMTEALPPNLDKKTLLAMGPGLGTEPETVALVRRLFQECELPLVADADALNALAGSDWTGHGRIRAITPHPGEMSRLVGKSIADVQADRLGAATGLAQERGVIVVLKGQRTLIAFPDGRVWINPTGSPAMATGGTGDILTGLIAGMMAQFRLEYDLAIAAAVYLHGLAGEIGARQLTESGLIATDLLRFLPDAIHACTNISDSL
jgi:hydroxyethylthiazole kinase-like uncharacterized protein yjeF